MSKDYGFDLWPQESGVYDGIGANRKISSSGVDAIEEGMPEGIEHEQDDVDSDE